MNTFSDFSFGNTLALSFVLQELIKDTFEFINETNLLEKFFQFVDPHDRHWDDLFKARWKPGFVCKIFGVIHFVEVGVKFIKFIGDVPETEYEDLILVPNFIEWGDKCMWILCNFINWSESRLDVMGDKILNIFPNKLIDLNFIFWVGFQFWNFVDMSELINKYPLI